MARGRDKDISRKRGTYLGGTRLTVLETKCLRRKLNIRSNKAEIVMITQRSSALSSSR